MSLILVGNVARRRLNQTSVANHRINVFRAPRHPIKRPLATKQNPLPNNRKIISLQFNHSPPFLLLSPPSPPGVPFQSLYFTCLNGRVRRSSSSCQLYNDSPQETTTTAAGPPPFTHPRRMNALKQDCESPPFSQKVNLFAAYEERNRHNSSYPVSVCFTQTTLAHGEPPPPTSEPQGPTSFIIDRIRQKETEN